MNEEEYFRKNYPDSCYGDKPLSPHWDFFQDGVEFGEQESEKKIKDLTEQNTSLLTSVENLNKSVQELEKENAELKAENEANENGAKKYAEYFFETNDQLTKAKELLKQWLQTSKASGCDNINILTDTEQFLNSEVEK